MVIIISSEGLKPIKNRGFKPNSISKTRFRNGFKQKKSIKNRRFKPNSISKISSEVQSKKNLNTLLSNYIKMKLHTIIQNILVEVLKEFGIDVRKEFLNIDIIGKKDNKLITIEIENSGNRALENCEKCLFINPTKHIHILIDTNPKPLEKYKDKIKILSYNLLKRDKDYHFGSKNKKAKKIVLELMNSKKPVKEQIIEFKKKTGLSRTTYFFIKGMILGRDVRRYNF
jgi:hypothetical protein